jgi:anti-anti-sigma factor
MIIEGRKEGGRIIVAVSGRMDAVSAPEFDRQCGAWVTEGANLFILDFSALEYISSAGLRSLLVLGKKLGAGKGRVVIASARDVVKEVFSISGFGSIFPMDDTVEAALQRP